MMFHSLMNMQTAMLFPLADSGEPMPMSIWIGAAVICAGGLLIFGLGDLRRLSLRRIWAIGSVCFRESIRRRVLWIIPLAIIGVVVVSQLQKVFDEQDVIRQTTKFCLFATGLVVTLTSIILACTNIPKEIQNRVIYTVVTKPTTRLELILGKIVGFARVSAVILLLMGVFSYGYLALRNWRQEQVMASRLQNDPNITGAERNRLEHGCQMGLLSAESYASADSLQIMAGAPDRGSSMRSIYGEGEEEFLFPFTTDRTRLFADPIAPGGVDPTGGIGKTGLLIGVKIKWQRFHQDAATAEPNTDQIPYIGIEILGQDQYSLISGISMFDPRFPGARQAHAQALPLPAANDLDHPGQTTTVWAYVPANQTGSLYQQPIFYVHVTGISTHMQFYAEGTSAFLMVSPPPADGNYAPTIPTAFNPPFQQLIFPDAGADGHPVPPLVRGRPGTHGGQELTGKPAQDPYSPVAVFHFRGDQLGGGGSGAAGKAPAWIPIELRMPITRGGDLDEEDQSTTSASVMIVPDTPDANSTSKPAEFQLENQQTTYGQLPAPASAIGDFDVILRCNSAGHVLAMEPTSLLIVRSRELFGWNLFKSLFIMWMLTVLVVAIAVLCSTFLSWPIAIVLTCMLLTGHWCVSELSDTADSTLGRSIATDMGLTDPSRAEAVATSVNALTSALQGLAVVLPDIDRFESIQDIQSGRAVSWDTISQAGAVLLAFGLSATVLAYLSMKGKEVAP
jgi:hypothetical protein